MSVFESNVYGEPFDLHALWAARQERAAALQEAEAPAAAAAAAKRTTSSTTVVRAVATEAVNVSGAASLQVDGETLTAGDIVLLTRQSTTTQNGPWVVGVPFKRPVGYVPTAGQQFHVSGGQTRRGTLFTTVSASTTGAVVIQPVVARPAWRDGVEERDYTSSLDIRAATLDTGTFAPQALTPADSANVRYIGTGLGLGDKPPVRLVATAPVDLRTPGATWPGLTPDAGDRVLLAAQTDPVENGLYVLGADRLLTRAADLRTGVPASGNHVFVTADAAAWVCTSPPNACIVGQHALSWCVMVETPADFAGNVASVVTSAFVSNLPDVEVARARRLVDSGQAVDQAANSAYLGGLSDLVVAGARTLGKGATAADLTTNTLYLDQCGLRHPAVRWAVLGSHTLSALVPSTVVTVVAENHQTADTPLQLGDRLLLFEMDDPVDNGVYAVTATGAVRAAPDMVSNRCVGGACVLDICSRSLWVCVSPQNADVVAQHPLTWRPVATNVPNVEDAVAAVVTSAYVSGLGDVQVARAAQLVDSGSTMDRDANRAYIGNLPDLVVSGARTLGTGATAADHAANTLYLDQCGLRHPAVQWAVPGLDRTVLPMLTPGTTLVVVAENNQTISVVIGLGDRLLMFDMNDAVDNGVYVVTNTGAVRAAPDMAPSRRVAGASVLDTGSRTMWVCTSPPSADVVGQDPLLWRTAVASVTDWVGNVSAVVTSAYVTGLGDVQVARAARP